MLFVEVKEETDDPLPSITREVKFALEPLKVMVKVLALNGASQRADIFIAKSV
jgi:hypothetical protein